MRQWTVDAFASAPFRGNPACVVEPWSAAYSGEPRKSAAIMVSGVPACSAAVQTANPSASGARPRMV